MTYAIEHLKLSELIGYLRLQADDAFPSLKDEKRLNMLAEKWYSHAEFCTCRDENGQLVGMIAFYANQPETKTAYIPHVFVSQTHRGCGIFTKMLCTIEKACIQKGYFSIKLETGTNRPNAIKSYLKNGFSICENKNNRIYFNKKLNPQ